MKDRHRAATAKESVLALQNEHIKEFRMKELKKIREMTYYLHRVRPMEVDSRLRQENVHKQRLL